MSVRDLYFAAPREAVEAMAQQNWRRVVLPGENHGLDLYVDPQAAVGAAQEMSRHETGEPAWAIRACILNEAFLKWREFDPLTQQLGDDAGSLFIYAENFEAFSYDLVEPLEVLGGYA